MTPADTKLQGCIVLVVEDDWLLRQELYETLLAAGCKVLEASTGEYAVNVLEENPAINLLICDIQLAGPMSGWDVAERARARRTELPIIYTSGNSPLEARQVPGSSFISKPCPMTAIVAACSQLVQRDAAT